MTFAVALNVSLNAFSGRVLLQLTEIHEVLPLSPHSVLKKKPKILAAENTSLDVSYASQITRGVVWHVFSQHPMM